MNAVTYILVDMPPFIVMGILYVNSLVRLPYLRENSLLRAVILATMGALLAGALSWVLDGRLAAEALYAINMLHFLFMGGIAFSWYLYVRYLVYEERSLMYSPFSLAVVCVPYAAFVVAVLATPWTHGVFYVDEGLTYQRGPLSLGLFAVGALYVLAATVLALVRRSKEEGAARRQRLLYLAAFAAGPIVGGALQAVLPGMDTMLPGIALSVVLTYVAVQRDELALDGLTGLNNRGSLDEHLAARCRATRSSRPWCLIVLDINDFKSVNDRCGHAMGDDALRQLAGALKRVFAKTSAFLARMGGDEFAVVYDARDEEDIRRVLADVRAVLKGTGQTRRTPYTLSVSVGWAWHGDGLVRPERLLEAADKAMYADKQQNKGTAHPRR